MEVYTPYQPEITKRPQYTRNRVYSHKHNNHVKKFIRPDLQVQQGLTYSIQLIASPPIITKNQSIENVTHDLTGSPGHKLAPNIFGGNRIGNGGPCRTHRGRRRECEH